MRRIFLTLSVAVLVACSSIDNKKVLESIVPMPAEISAAEGTINLRGAKFVCGDGFDEKTSNVVADFNESLRYGCCSKECSVVFDEEVSAEGYELKVSEDGVEIKASDRNGVLYAFATLRQMMPVYAYKGKACFKPLTVPCCEIKDCPRFSYRGMHLDESRHFFGKEEVMKYLDIMAVYKLNRLHWHLTDDQGWRIEIKKYPKLTEISAFRNGTQIGRDRSSNDGVRYGGFYTQDKIKEIVAYADKLGITVIPEIDLPGHMVAALTAYPEMGCTGGPYEVRTCWGIADEALCPGKEVTFEFIEGVLSEVIELFPSEYINIGGDECRKKFWKECPDCQRKIEEIGLKSDEHATKEQRLQNYVTARVQKFLNDRGRKIIGWDEILEGELTEGATVMSWRGSKGGIKGANMGYDVVMSPKTHFYFDYSQSYDLESEPLGITKDSTGVVTYEKTYSFDPFDKINPEARHHIIGVQANLWTEYIATPEHLEYMLLPRMLSLSEVQWCQEEQRDFERFDAALKGHQLKIFDLLGYNYRRP